MSTIPVTDPHKAWNVKQFKRLEAYNARLQKLLDNAIKKAAAIAMRHDANASDEHLFSFSDDKQMKAEADKLMKDLSDEITSFTQSAIGKEWEKALQQATEYIGQIYNLAEQTQNRQDSFLDMMLGMRSRNEDALIEFNKRKIGGLNLSKKVWGYTQDFERQLEVSIDTALMQGMSANNLALSIQSLLKDPDDLFRRVRDENDQLRMSKAMAAYHPGTGKYRSAYKNAMRLARSEINMAYRASDCNTAQMLDCVVGIQINLSNNHTNNGEPFTDICDQLAGKYPKDFKFVGWHPQCRCFITYILKTDDEFWEDLENGENNESVNTVKDVPDNFKEWVKDNEERIAKTDEQGTLPYFVKDNKEYIISTQQALSNKTTFTRLSNFPSWDIECTDLFMDAKDVDKWFEYTPYSKLDISMLNMQINDALRQIGILPQDATKVIKLNPDDNSMEMQLLFEHNGEMAKIIRKFIYNPRNDYLSVSHLLFDIPKDLQGKGFSRSILSSFYEQYKKMGVNKIELYANLEVGGYAWSRYGFHCSEGKDGVIHVIATSETKKHADFTEAWKILEDYYKTRDTNDAFPMRLLTGYKWSKDVLLGTEWEGCLMISDKEQAKIFEEYLNIKHQ